MNNAKFYYQLRTWAPKWANMFPLWELGPFNWAFSPLRFISPIYIEFTIFLERFFPRHFEKP